MGQVYTLDRISGLGLRTIRNNGFLYYRRREPRNEEQTDQRGHSSRAHPLRNDTNYRREITIARVVALSRASPAISAMRNKRTRRAVPLQECCATRGGGNEDSGEFRGPFSRSRWYPRDDNALRPQTPRPVVTSRDVTTWRLQVNEQ